MKKKLVLTIDEIVLKKAKENIPNISNFTEECLKHYLGLNTGEYPVHNAKELLNKISECQLELHLLNEENKLNENSEKAKQELIGSTWRILYATYRDTKNVPKTQLDEAEKILDVPSSELNNILELCFIFRDEIDVTDWEKVYAEYRGVE